MAKEWWLDFQSNKFSEDACFLNVKVNADGEGGNSAETTITFDTYNNGGNPIEVESAGDLYSPSFKERSGIVKITLRGGIEAGDFFEAMRNLVKAYDMRCQLGA